jgi:hypothetical protein
MTTTPNEPVENPPAPDRDPDANPDIDPQPQPDEGDKPSEPDTRPGSVPVKPSSGDPPLTADPDVT